MTGKTYAFVLALPGRELSSAEMDALRQGLGRPSSIESGPSGSRLYVTREAASRKDAVAAALADVRKVPGLDPVLEDRV